MREYNIDDTIAATATAPGVGPIGIVRMSGKEALKIADSVFVSRDGRRPSDYETYTVHYGHIADIDEVLLTVMRAPKSYTREDIVEINCHGGMQAVKKVLDLVVKQGARIAQPGEFTKRAFLNGRIDLAQAEAVLDVINAKTEGSLKAAVGQLDGRLSREVSAILDSLIDISSHIEASIDFPDEDTDIIEEGELEKKLSIIIDKIKNLIDSFGDGLVLREGVLAVICGKPNVGKSSLMNLLLKRDRVIVAPIPGTTRDAVEEMISLNGVPIRIVDTAGIGKANDILYKESSEKSRRYIDSADIVIAMLDASAKINEEDLEIVRLIKAKRKLVVINKTDLNPKAVTKDSVIGLFKDDPVVEISIKDKSNIELLEKSILEMVWTGKFAQGEAAIVTNARHKELLDKAFGSVLSVIKALKDAAHPELIAVDLKEAVFNLGLIVGRSASSEVLDRIFENFCIGK